MLNANAQAFVPRMNPNAPVFVPINANPVGQQPIVMPPPQVPAPVQLMPPQNAPLAPPGIVIGYRNNFESKHIADVIMANSAVSKGQNRGPNVTYSTVFKRAYLAGVVLADAQNKGPGNYSMSIACHAAGAGNFALAERTSKGWKALTAPMFFCKVVYSVASNQGGARTAELLHIETDF